MIDIVYVVDSNDLVIKRKRNQQKIVLFGKSKIIII